MNKVTFLLKRTDANTPQAVLAQFRTGNGRLKVYTGVSAHPKDWDKRFNKQRLKPSAMNAVLLNSRLDQIEADLKHIAADLLSKRIHPTPELVRTQFDALYARETSRSGKLTFLDYFQNWIDQSANSKTPQTLKLHSSVKAKLEEYQVKKGARLTFDRMDREFVNSFTDFLIRFKGLQNSTVWHNVKTWKAFMNWAVKTGLTTNTYHEQVTKKSYNVQAPDVLRLTEEEFRILAEADFSDSPALDNARKLFVLQCCLGVRVSDLLKIVSNPEAYRVGNNIRITTQKNKKQVLIPVLPYTENVMFGDSPPHEISNAKLNKYIKEAAKEAKLNRLITKAEFRGTNRKDITVPLHEDIATHWAKRTFISLMAAKGLSHAVIKAITGNTDATLDRYLNLDESEIEREMEKVKNLLRT